MAQQKPSVLIDKPADRSHTELSQQLQDTTESKKKLEDTVKGLEEKLSIAEQEKLQMQKVNIRYHVNTRYHTIKKHQSFKNTEYKFKTYVQSVTS